MKKRIFTMVIIMVLLLTCSSFVMAEKPTAENTTLIDSASKFTDITANKWYKDAVDYVVTYGVFNGTSSNTFNPSGEMTRAQFVQVLANLEGVDTTNRNVQTSFKDVPSGKWFTPAVKWASEKGVVNGVGDGKFAPNDLVTREQICVLIVRYSNYKSVILKQINEKLDFVDDGNISKWAKDDVYTCQRSGIVNGKPDGRFDPKLTATRAEAAKILMVFHSDYFAKTETDNIPDNSTPDPEPTPDDPSGGIIDGGVDVEDNPHNNTVITNDNGFVPDEEMALEKSERRATEASRYSFDENIPFINRDRPWNKTWEPSFDIDDTGFVRAGTKLADLKGKTLCFFTSDNFATWSYRNAKGETVDEWSWFKELKSELGLNIKYTVKQHMKSTTAALQAMNAGKQCDIIYSNHVVFPSSICITRSITEFVNINNLGSSPGICKKTMDICKWGNTLRIVAPIGNVDVLWYNQTLTQELGLSDPHAMWENGAWNWTTFKSFMLSIPKTTKDDKELTAFVQWPTSSACIWPATNGSPYIHIKPDADVPTIINNWDSELTIEAWEFITSVCNSVNYGSSFETSAGVQPEYIGLYEGTTMMTSTMYPQIYRDTEYSKHIQINWVPYPKSTNDTGADVCQFNGSGMMLPKKTVKEDNVNFALKFMELWATRFTETIFDNLHSFEYYNFNYNQRKQYFDFVTNYVTFSLQMNDFAGSDLVTETNFYKCFTGDPAYNVKTEAAKASNYVKAYIIESMKFGQ